jgi:hypothetical protein
MVGGGETADRVGGHAAWRGSFRPVPTGRDQPDDVPLLEEETARLGEAGVR